MTHLPPILLALAAFAGCSRTPAASPVLPAASPATAEPAAAPIHEGPDRPLAPPPPEGMREAVFAGGCFWCMEPALEAVAGVRSVESGFTGGNVPHANYEEVSRGHTGHYEAVRVVYDPARVDYATLSDVFLHNVDPTQDDGQFCDHGPQYRAAFFVADDAERAAADAALARIAPVVHAPVVVAVLPRAPFYLAESYHQDFYRTHEEHYRAYRLGCGRDARLRELYGSAAGGH